MIPKIPAHNNSLIFMQTDTFCSSIVICNDYCLVHSYTHASPPLKSLSGFSHPRLCPSLFLLYFSPMILYIRVDIFLCVSFTLEAVRSLRARAFSPMSFPYRKSILQHDTRSIFGNCKDKLCITF